MLSSAYTNIYLDEPARKRLAKDKKLRAEALAALRSVEGVEVRLLGSGSRDRTAARESSDPVLRAAALSHNPGRSGDIIIAPQEKWLMSTAVTTHGTQYAYDQRVPVIFFGDSVRPGKYGRRRHRPISMPTLAAVARVKIAKTDGRVLIACSSR